MIGINQTGLIPG